MEYAIKIIHVSDECLESASRILVTPITASDEDKLAIRKVLKALIDESEEVKREERLAGQDGSIAQINTLSPPDVVVLAKRISLADLPQEPRGQEIRRIAKAYVFRAEKNQLLFDEFKKAHSL